MSKAYDRVEWKFLHEVMLRLGFDRRWAELVMNCVTTVRYQVKVNGDATEIIIPERGLRQGDPLSPYLFLFCMEGFFPLRWLLRKRVELPASVVQLAKEVGVSKIALETDCMGGSGKLFSKEINWSVHAPLIEEIKSLSG
jgi:hypothetical protein